MLAVLTLAGWLTACQGSPDSSDPDPSPDPGNGVGVIGTVPPLTPGVLPVDLIIDDRLYHAGGEIPLTDLLACSTSCQITGGWRVPDGWLVSVYHRSATASPDTSVLWWVPESGEPSTVVTGHGVTVSRGSPSRPGVQVSWVADGRLNVGTYADGEVDDVVSTPAPEIEIDDQSSRPLYPRMIAGEAVVLAGTQTGGGLDLWDVWFPDRGDYEPDVYPHIGLYAVTADGERLIAWYPRSNGSKEGCLGELDPDGFEPVRSVCPAPFPESATIYLAPGGRWWIVLHQEGVDVYDAERVWASPAPVRSLPGLGAWIDPSTFIVLAGPETFVGFPDGRPDQRLPQTVPGPITPAGVVVDLRDRL